MVTSMSEVPGKGVLLDGAGVDRDQDIPGEGPAPLILRDDGRAIVPQPGP